MEDKRLFRELDRVMLAMIFAVVAIGLAAIYSATQTRAMPFTESYLGRQLSWLGAGVIVLVIAARVDYQRFVDAGFVLFGCNVLLLAFVLIVGHVRLGAQRWFSIGSFAFQPSEFIKLNFILALASFLGPRRETITRVENLLISVALVAVPFALVVVQPDLGTALLLVPIFLAMLLVSGARVMHIVTMIALGCASMPVFWHALRDYQKQRLLVFINPNVDPLGAGYTIIQSKIAIGSGGLIGKGWLSGTQSKLNFLPERHTDFIFSVIGEEWGLVGAVILIALYLLIIRRALTTAALTRDMHGRLIAVGIAVMISLQVIINIAMTIGMMPVVGIPLPLVSYGGSSLIATMASIGLLLNIGMRRSRF